MLVLCTLWGLQQVAVKVAAPSLNPVLQIGVRSLVATALLLGLMWVRRERIWPDTRTLGPGILAGLAFGLEFLFVAWGLILTTASHMVVFLYTAPIFTALGLHWFVPGERLHPGQWLGIILAFIGIGCAFSGGFFLSGHTVPASMLLGDFFGILAGFLWGATTLIIRSTALSDAPATRTMLYQLSIAGLLLTAAGYAIFQDGAITMTPIAWASMAYQSLLVGFASLLVWFWLLRQYLASRLSAFSFLTPLFGVVFGVVLLDEPLDGMFGVGAVLVSAGIILVNLKPAQGHS